MYLLAITDQTWIITIVGYLVVFAALILLICVFLLVPRLIQGANLAKLKKQGKVKESVKPEDLEISGDVNAAIATALYLYLNDQHDNESGVITIDKIERRYSPWSSKVHSMNQFKR